MIEKGSVVFLKSGGPPLVVRDVVGEFVLVMWFGGFGSNQITNDCFPLATLTEKVEEDKSKEIAKMLSLVPKEPA